MEQVKGQIHINYTDHEINQIIRSNTEDTGAPQFTLHFNQNEDFFIRSEREFAIPSFSVHHDVNVKHPEKDYLIILRALMEELVKLFPQVFEGMTYFFDPAETLRPCFFQIFRFRECQYLYLLRLDFHFKPHDCEIISQGTNDATTTFRTNNLFLEADIIPLEKTVSQNGKLQAMVIKQTVDQTWIGETGRGYFVQGIWMDSELTKFFSKLFLPPEKRIYPYYPFVCKYRTIVFNLADLSFSGRKKYLPYLVEALKFIEPEMKRIQEALRKVEFSTDLPLFQEIKRQVPERWRDAWENIGITRYLNDKDMKEFSLELQA